MHSIWYNLLTATFLTAACGAAVVKVALNLDDQAILGVVKARASGVGHSVASETWDECLNLCRDHSQCDAVNYHPTSHKCRIFYRCTPYQLHNDSTQFIHFSKRPIVHEKGYVYDMGTNSCIKVIEKQTTFEVADKYCQSNSGRLASLTDPSINALAAKLLRQAKVQYAWIGLMDKESEGNPSHTNGKKVSSTGFFPLAQQQHRNDSKRNCWSLTDRGEWAEHSCKGRRQYSICQIPPYLA